MTGLNPLVEKDTEMADIMPPSSITPAITQGSTGIGDTNNTLSSFQDITTSSEVKDSTDKTSELGEAIAEATKSEDSSQENDEDKNTASDERLKRFNQLYGDTGSDLLDCISGLNAYIFKYKDEAKELPNAEEKGVDDDQHVGIMAQELADNPVTQSAVSEDPLTGFLQVDTKELATTELAILTAMAKRIIALEESLNKLIKSDKS